MFLVLEINLELNQAANIAAFFHFQSAWASYQTDYWLLIATERYPIEL
jgi:hypothetical protein